MRHDECPMAIALREARPVTGEAIAVRPDGTQVPFAAYPEAAARRGRPAQRRGEHAGGHQPPQGSRGTPGLLINELNHRVKNTLATVQSIAIQSLRGCPDGELRWFQGRLVALSQAHDVLTDQTAGAGIRELFARVTAPLIGPDDRRFECAGPDLFLTPRMALSLSLALHELGTNAAKYGALSRPQGRVLVAWSLSGRNGSSRLRLRWEEAGGPPVQAPRRKGFVPA